MLLTNLQCIIIALLFFIVEAVIFVYCVNTYKAKENIKRTFSRAKRIFSRKSIASNNDRDFFTATTPHKLNSHVTWVPQESDKLQDRFEDDVFTYTK